LGGWVAGGKTTVTGSGREVWRKKKIPKKRKRKERISSWTGGQRNKGGERE